jgi:hypothetical protein
VTRQIDFVIELPKGEFVSSCWRNSVSKMVAKSAKIHHPCKCCLDVKKGHPDARRILFFPRASFAISFAICKPVWTRSITKNSREPHLQSHLQARLDEIDNQEFLRASSAISFAPHPNAPRQEINVVMIIGEFVIP